MAHSETATITCIEGCCDRIDVMCADLDEEGWHRRTSLPGWDVQDVVAHLGSVEGMLLGRTEPEHETAPAAHVRNPLGERNERMVDRRRAWSGAAVLDEFRETTALRLELLRALDEDQLDREVPSPFGGTLPLRRFLGVRVWDFLIHEHDIAEALGIEPDVSSAAAVRVLDETLFLLGRAAARGGIDEAAVVLVEIGEPQPRRVAVRVQGGRGVPVDPSAAGEAALHLRASPAAFLRVAGGRRDAAGAVAARELSVVGDTRTASTVLAALNVVP